MNIQALTKQLYISAQLNEQTIQEAKALGIQSVVCNRPDHEEDNQPTFNDIEKLLKAVDIHDILYLPISMPTLNQNQVAEFINFINHAPKPVLAFCRTGTRSTLLWALHQVASGVSVNDVIAQADQIGIDLRAAEAKLQEAAKNTN